MWPNILLGWAQSIFNLLFFLLTMLSLVEYHKNAIFIVRVLFEFIIFISYYSCIDSKR